MPTRATKRGGDRTPLEGPSDVLVCGASFAGLAAARELAGSGADVLVVDRYEIGERQTSACGIPTEWLRATGLMDAERQRFDSLLIHTPHGSRRFRLPWTFSTFDYRELCDLLWRECDARFETAKVNGRGAPADGDGRIAVETDRGTLTAPLVVDALGWRRVLASNGGHQPPDAPLSRGLEVHPGGSGEDLGRERVRYQGNWIPHELRRATEGGVFFAGDSAGHCLPLTAEGIRTALYFGSALGRELRAVHAGGKTREEAAAAYASFHDSHEWKFRWMLRAQRLVPRIPPRLLGPLIRALGYRPFVDWSFGHYLRIAPPVPPRSPAPEREPEPAPA